MIRTPHIASRLVALVVLALCPALAAAVAQQADPTACIGNDLGELTEASKADPSNIGLRMRIVRRTLDLVQTSDNRRKQRELLTRIREQLDEIKKLGPEFTYVYRVLARQHERKGEFEEVLAVLEDFAKVTQLDFPMRKLKVRAMLALADDEESPRPELRAAAADFVVDWFASTTAPVFAETLASTESWMLDGEFREALLSRYEARFAETPGNVNLAISYASGLYASGRYESAWKVIHAAERIGLCDDVIGGRHPLVTLLGWRCKEFGAGSRYEGLDLDVLRRLAKEDSENLSFVFRLAVRLKAKAFTGERLIKSIGERIKDYDDDLEQLRRRAGDEAEIARIQEKIGLLEKDRTSISKQVDETYREALPYALEVRRRNKEIDAAALLLADLNAKLGKLDDAVTYLEESIARVPFFVPLRDKLVQTYREKKNWKACAEALVGVCRLVSCRSADWDEDVPGSILPVPRVERERIIADMARDESARKELVAAFEKAAADEPRNPNLKTFLAMIHYYAGNAGKAATWMRNAEALGICAGDGSEHALAAHIYSREKW